MLLPPKTRVLGERASEVNTTHRSTRHQDTMFSTANDNIKEYSQKSPQNKSPEKNWRKKRNEFIEIVEIRNNSYSDGNIEIIDLECNILNIVAMFDNM